MILTISIDELLLSADEDHSDGVGEKVKLKDKNEAQALTLSLFMTMKNQLGANMAKAIIFKCALQAGIPLSQAGIPLSQAAKRDSASVVDSVDIQMLHEKIVSFTNTTMDFIIMQIPNRNTESILKNCRVIHQKIKKFDATKSASQVTVFASFIKM